MADYVYFVYTIFIYGCYNVGYVAFGYGFADFRDVAEEVDHVAGDGVVVVGFDFKAEFVVDLGYDG